MRHKAAAARHIGLRKPVRVMPVRLPDRSGPLFASLSLSLSLLTHRPTTRPAAKPGAVLPFPRSKKRPCLPHREAGPFSFFGTS